jgi:hypothetical protein
MHRIVNVVPNERWQLVIEFADEGHRLFEGEIARVELGWREFAFPNKLKNLTFTAQQVIWPGGRILDSSYLYANATPLEGDALRTQSLRLGYGERSDHVYGIYLFPFRERPFEPVEIIAGAWGGVETGDFNACTLTELVACPEWRRHFELSGCDWAIAMVESAPSERELVGQLVKQVCLRQGL